MKTEKDPDHPIIEKPYEYNIKELKYCINWDDFRESYIDLTLIKETTSRKLRFIGPQNLEIEKGFPMPTRGMCILDVRQRQLEGIKVHVSDFEASNGAITFYARDVVDITDEQA